MCCRRVKASDVSTLIQEEIHKLEARKKSPPLKRDNGMLDCMLYLAQRESFIRAGKKLFSDAIFASRCGPSVLTSQSSTPIRISSLKKDKRKLPSVLTEEARMSISCVVKIYGMLDSDALFRITSTQESWQSARRVAKTVDEAPPINIRIIKQDAERAKCIRKMLDDFVGCKK